MNKIDLGGPAFPQEIINNGDKAIHGPTGEIITPNVKANFYGLFARDYFAAAALQGLLSADGNDPRWTGKDTGPDFQRGGGKWMDPQGVAKQAYEIADAMIAARDAK